MAQSGRTLVEGLATITLLALSALAAAPVFEGMRAEAAVSSLDRRLRAMVFRCRATALMRGRTMALVFDERPGGGWTIYVAQDGDGDGVLQRDIDSGVDPVVSRPIRVAAGEAGPGILTGVRVPDPLGRGVLRGDPSDPIRAGRGDKISFSPGGTATPASIYLTDHRRSMRVVRVYGATARAYSMAWRVGWPAWRASGV
jgi:hypothetical protein